VHVVEPHHLYQMISHPMASKNNLEMYVNKDGVGRYEALLESMTLGSGEAKRLVVRQPSV
jgi:hypothetical protein